MLRLMRENAGSWIIKILLGIVVLVFMFLGIGPGDTKNQNTAVVVNKQVITMDEYRVAYNNLIERYRSQFGDNLNDEFIKMLGIKEITLENLIDSKLIIQEAIKLDIKVTNEEVYNAISGIKSFQENGQFSQGRYSNYIKYSRQSPEYFEAKQQEALMLKKLQGFIADTVHVSDAEVREWFRWEKALVNIDYEVLKSEDFTDITPSEEEVLKYYEENGQKYKTEPKVKFSYIRFSPDDYRDKVSVEDSEIEAYYTANQDNYEKAKTVEARHILIKLDEGAGAEVIASARIKADEVYSLAIAEGQDFAELAKIYSEGPSRDNGGSLGAFEKERMVKPFADKAFSMKAGEISEPVKTQFGWHVIKIEKINEASKRQLAEVRPEIEKALTKERSENLAYDESELAYDAIIGGDELKQAGKASNKNVMETQLFTQEAGPLEINPENRMKLSKTAFEMADNEISDILDFEGEYYILHITKKLASEVKPLEDVKTAVVADLTKSMQDAQAKKMAEERLASLKSGSNTFEGSKDVKTTGFFNRDNDGSDISIDREVISASFKLSPEKKLADEPIKGNKGYYVICLKEKKEPEETDFEKAKDKIKVDLLSKKKRKTFDNWLAQIRSQSKIERNKNFFN